MKIFISFGQAHKHNINGKIFDKDCIGVMECETREQGHDKAFGLFGNKWSMSYIDEPDIKYYPRGFIDIE